MKIYEKTGVNFSIKRLFLILSIFYFSHSIVNAQVLRPLEKILTHQLGKEFLYSKEGEAVFEKILGRSIRNQEMGLEIRSFAAEIEKLPNKQSVLDSLFLKKAEFKKLPLASSYLDNFLSLPANKKFTALEVAFPSAVKLIKDVPTVFRIEEGSFVRQESRDVLIISLKDLANHPRKEKFLDTYFRILSKEVVSFPLDPSAGHLKIRMGNTSFDYYHSLRNEAFRLPNFRKMEPLLQLSELEQMNLRKYFETIKGNERDILGPWNYDGVASASTQNELSKNIPLIAGEGHNCTSWIATAPVGANQEKLLELAGAFPALEVHTNPGWWNYYLSQGAPKSRVPVVVYWTDTSLVEAVNEVKENKFFQRWHYNHH